ncbi:putative UDP-Gal or UDP-GlcNAc-dependent glycosyltransferase [Trypanosoma cruzi]|uniref:Putative UDP-Gal or UDP-GlcNAc-dependent glycosyltransferase n=1 Tax=Trypanosoma cruzi TaxID=5693 RepID=A0A2V2V0R6_TRYCR|nr:putative UDP-Gal or UDP-GlcNAc-dependent glycosyltransferase [Trypanosoma cruzi]
MGLPGYTFMSGWCYTLSRDVAEALVSYKPLRRLAYLPYSKERDHEFVLLQFHGEDSMVGYVLENEVKYRPLVYVKVLPCHFLDARNETGHSQVVPSMMCAHHVREEDYRSHGALSVTTHRLLPVWNGSRRTRYTLFAIEKKKDFFLRVCVCSCAC